MPNWCHNCLVIKHDDLEMINKLVSGFNNNCLLGTFIPMPVHLSADSGADLIDLSASVLKHDPKLTWIDWAQTHWGTKWDTGIRHGNLLECTNDGRNAYFRFETAWAPPIAAFRTWAELGFDVECYFDEVGMELFGIYNNGEIKQFGNLETLSFEVKKFASAELFKLFFIDERIKDYLNMLNAFATDGDEQQ